MIRNRYSETVTDSLSYTINRENMKNRQYAINPLLYKIVRTFVSSYGAKL